MLVADVEPQVEELSETIAAVDVAVSPKYDDPYEENPLALAKHSSNVESKSSEVTVVGASHDCGLSTPWQTTVSEPRNECKLAAQCSAPPMRSFELSAEYGGFFVPEATTDRDVGATKVDQRPSQQAARAEAAPACAVGLYNEPWDLSTVQRGIEERLRSNTQKDARRAVVDIPTGDVYSQPQKQQHRTVAASKPISDPRVTNCPNYGVLCERISDNGFIAPPPLARRRAGVRNDQPMTWSTDSRPLADYDVPWDQKKKSTVKTSKSKLLNALNLDPTLLLC